VRWASLAALHTTFERYLVLSCGNFYAEKQHNNKVLPFGAKGAANYAPLTWAWWVIG